MTIQQKIDQLLEKQNWSNADMEQYEELLFQLDKPVYIHFRHPLHDFLTIQHGFEYHNLDDSDFDGCPKRHKRFDQHLSLCYRKRYPRQGAVEIVYSIINNQTNVRLWSGMGVAEDYSFGLLDVSCSELETLLSLIAR